MDEKREMEEEIKKVIDEIIEAKQNINNAIHKIIEIPDWYVEPMIKADLRTNAVQINDSIENIFYKINNEHNEYNGVLKNALFECLKKKLEMKNKRGKKNE